MLYKKVAHRYLYKQSADKQSADKAVDKYKENVKTAKDTANELLSMLKTFEKALPKEMMTLKSALKAVEKRLDKEFKEIISAISKGDKLVKDLDEEEKQRIILSSYSNQGVMVLKRIQSSHKTIKSMLKKDFSKKAIHKAWGEYFVSGFQDIEYLYWDMDEVFSGEAGALSGSKLGRLINESPGWASFYQMSQPSNWPTEFDFVKKAIRDLPGKIGWFW